MILPLYKWPPQLSPREARGGGIPKLYVKFWWSLFLAMKFTFLFLNLAKIQILMGLGIIFNKNIFVHCFLYDFLMKKQ